MSSVSEDVGSEGLYEVECILAARTMDHRREYLVKWDGYPSNKSTWEPASSLRQCKEHVEKFNRAREQHRQLQLKLKAGLRERRHQSKPRERRIDHEKKNPSSSSSSAGSTSLTGTPRSNSSSRRATVLSKMQGVDGEVLFRMKIDDEEYILHSDDVTKKHPQALLAFYESRLDFK